MDLQNRDIKRIKKELIVINERLWKLTSLKYNFLLSIVRGVGTILGFTIVFALLLAILSWIIEALGGSPLLERLLQIGQEQAPL
jgi:hypothetical protein